MQLARRLSDSYTFPGFRPLEAMKGVFGDPKARVVTLDRREKTICGYCGRAQSGWYDRNLRRVRDLSCGDTRVYLEFEVRRVQRSLLRKVRPTPRERRLTDPAPVSRTPG